MSNMKQREPPNVPNKVKTEVDKIGHLPRHIIDKILSYLSLRDAVRTSVLSTRWRYKWVTLPYLVFDNQTVLVSTQDETLIKNKLVSIVDHVLLLHNGPIHKFKLSHRDLQDVSDIDKWIIFLSRGSVKEFILEIWKGHHYKLPSSIYNFQNLVHLELFNCLLLPPFSFIGFKSLKSLDLQHITMDQSAFEYMISSCPLLERLTLMNLPLLIYMLQIFFSLTLEAFLKMLVSKTHPSRLSSLLYLAAGTIPGKLPKPCVDLGFLSIRINFNDVEENLAAVCLLRSSPHLQELEMLARAEEQQANVRTTSNIPKNIESFAFKQLKFIKIVGISGIKQELNFINFLLGNSPVLERMTVKPASVDGGWDLLKELLRFRRASVHAEIIYIDP